MIGFSFRIFDEFNEKFTSLSDFWLPSPRQRQKLKPPAKLQFPGGRERIT